MNKLCRFLLGECKFLSLFGFLCRICPVYKSRQADSMSSGLVSASQTLASFLPHIGLAKAIAMRIHYEEIYFERYLKAKGFSFNWVRVAILRRLEKDRRKPSDWDKEFAWDMWRWFNEGLEEGLIGEELFEFMEEAYWETIAEDEYD